MIDFRKQLTPEIALTFKDGKFVLTASNTAALRRNPHWTCVDLKTYETVNLRAAAAFRSHSDERALKIFN